MYRRSVASSEQSDARMREQRVVESCAAPVGGDLVERQRPRVVGEINERETRAVGHDDVVRAVDAVLLRQNELANSVAASDPIARAKQDASRAPMLLRRRMRGRLEELRAHVGVLRRIREAFL